MDKLKLIEKIQKKKSEISNGVVNDKFCKSNPEFTKAVEKFVFQIYDSIINMIIET